MVAECADVGSFLEAAFCNKKVVPCWASELSSEGINITTSQPSNTKQGAPTFLLIHMWDRARWPSFVQASPHARNRVAFREPPVPRLGLLSRSRQNALATSAWRFQSV